MSILITMDYISIARFPHALIPPSPPPPRPPIRPPSISALRLLQLQRQAPPLAPHQARPVERSWLRLHTKEWEGGGGERRAEIDLQVVLCCYRSHSCGIGFGGARCIPSAEACS